jgi:GNAT superfamily N-acetyltransferase
MVPITFRDAVSPRDREVVRSIIERTGFFRADEVAVAVELVDERLSRGEASGYYFVFAETPAGDVAGYACYGPIGCTVASFDLYWIAVEPRFQTRGIGRQLMAAVELRIAEAGGLRIYIDTAGKPQYASTRAFYEKSGFRCDARLADFYAPGDDRVIYVKVIEQCRFSGDAGALPNTSCGSGL